MPRIGRHFMPNMSRAAWGFMQSGDFPVPVLHLKFGKNTGAVAYDSSPEGNDGTIEGASWVKGYLGPGLSFDGLDDYVSVDPAVSPDAISLLLRMRWIGDDENANVNTWMLGTRAENGVALMTGYGGHNVRARLYTATLSYSTDAYGLHDALSHLLAMTYDKADGILRLFVDSVQRQTKDVGVGETIKTPTSFRVGYTQPASATRAMIVDEVLAFDVGLTAAQIRQLDQGYR